MRRPSTGGKPPARVRYHPVVEEAPSHTHRTPCITAWEREEIFEGGQSTAEPKIKDNPPMWSIQVYDTTP